MRDGLEQPSVLIISSDSWSAGAMKNERVISRPPVLLIRKRTVHHHRMNWLPNAWGGKLLVAVCVVFIYISTFEFNSALTFLKYFIHNRTVIRTHFYGKQRYSSERTSPITIPMCTVVGNIRWGHIWKFNCNMKHNRFNQCVVSNLGLFKLSPLKLV